MRRAFGSFDENVPSICTNCSNVYTTIDFGKEYYKREPDNIYGYDFTGMYNVNMDECNACWDANIDYYLSLPPRDGAKEVIDELHKKGYKIYIITARVDELLFKTKKWLKDNNIYYDFFYNPGEDKSECIINNKKLRTFCGVFYKS